ncbi:hypothetical protein CW304_30985 [Bacillus sp. UFRGS-B20]|nr:hypothetical protein CW304_30985 [Bacillus sp. UFRGS-B20]
MEKSQWNQECFVTLKRNVKQVIIIKKFNGINLHVITAEGENIFYRIQNRICTRIDRSWEEILKIGHQRNHVLFVILDF